MNKIYTKSQVTDVVNQIDTSPAHKLTESVRKGAEKKSDYYLKEAQKVQKEVTSQEKQAKIEADKQQKQAFTTFKNNLSTSNKMTTRSLFNQHKADPQALQQAFDDQNEELVNTIEDEELRNTMVLNNMLEQQTYVFKAQDEFNKTQLKQSKSAFENNINSNLQTIRDQATVFFSPYDNATENARRVLVQNTFNNIAESVNAKNPDGTDVFTAKQKEAYQKQINDAKIGGYKSQLDEMYLTDPTQAEEYADYVNKNSQEVMEKYSLNREDYDKLRSYNKTANSVYKELVNKTNPDTGMPYTDAEKASVVNMADGIILSYQDIKAEVKNKNTPDLNQLINLRKNISVLNGYDNKAISKEKQRSIMVDTSRAIYSQIEDNTTSVSWGDNVMNRLSNLVAKEMKEDPNLDISKIDRVNVFETVYNNLIGEDIKTNSTQERDLNKVDQLYKRAKETYFKKKYPSAYDSKATMIYNGKSIQTFTEKGDNNLGLNVDIEGGYELERMDGRLYRVKYDKDGNLIHRVLAI